MAIIYTHSVRNSYSFSYSYSINAFITNLSLFVSAWQKAEMGAYNSLYFIAPKVFS